jgi:hypothetical protein
MRTREEPFAYARLGKSLLPMRDSCADLRFTMCLPALMGLSLCVCMHSVCLCVFEAHRHAVGRAYRGRLCV